MSPMLAPGMGGGPPAARADGRIDAGSWQGFARDHFLMAASRSALIRSIVA